MELKKSSVSNNRHLKLCWPILIVSLLASGSGKANPIRGQNCAAEFGNASESIESGVRSLAKSIFETDQINTESGLAAVMSKVGDLLRQPIETLRNSSLREALYAHGIKLDPESAMDEFKKISDTNRDNLIRKFSDGSARASPEVEKAINRVQIAFVHNTHFLKNLTALPILSSRRIEEIGFTGGHNTARFNKAIMRSDDQIFFTAMPYLRGQKIIPDRNLYGDRVFVVDEDYSKQFGWVSQFVMYDSDLNDFISAQGIDDKGYFQSRDENDFSRIPEYLSKLGPFDLTVTDFVLVLKSILGSSLNIRQMFERNGKSSVFKLKYIPRISSEDALKRLSTGQGLSELIEDYVYKRLGMAKSGELFYVEMKIPVMVPSDKLMTVK